MIDADVVLLDLYDTVADGAWGDLATIVMERLGIDRETLFRAFDETRPARSVGAFGSSEGDMAAVIAACGVEVDPAAISELVGSRRSCCPRERGCTTTPSPASRELRGAGICARC